MAGPLSAFRRVSQHSTGARRSGVARVSESLFAGSDRRFSTVRSMVVVHNSHTAWHPPRGGAPGRSRNRKFSTAVYNPVDIYDSFPALPRSSRGALRLQLEFLAQVSPGQSPASVPPREEVAREACFAIRGVLHQDPPHGPLAEFPVERREIGTPGASAPTAAAVLRRALISIQSSRGACRPPVVGAFRLEGLEHCWTIDDSGSAEFPVKRRKWC